MIDYEAIKTDFHQTRSHLLDREFNVGRRAPSGFGDVITCAFAGSVIFIAPIFWESLYAYQFRALLFAIFLALMIIAHRVQSAAHFIMGSVDAGTGSILWNDMVRDRQK